MRDSPKFRVTFEVQVRVHLFSTKLPFYLSSLQPDSLMMLSEHQFDYNKWICQGVGYLRAVDAEQYRERIMKRHEKSGVEVHFTYEKKSIERYHASGTANNV